MIKLTRTMLRQMVIEANQKGYLFPSGFVIKEGIGVYYPKSPDAEFGKIVFNTPELQTFYLLRWSA